MKVFVVLLAGLFTATSAHALDKEEIARYYNVDGNQYMVDNAIVAAIGLNAPADVEDSYAWALNLAQQEGLRFRLKRVSGKLPVTIAGKTQGLNCWLGKKPAELGHAENGKSCYTRQEVEKAIADNPQFLRRYSELARMWRFINLPEHFMFNVQEFMAGEKLFLINLTLNAEKDRETSLKVWLMHMKSVRNWNADQGTFVERSIGLVIYSLAEKQLPAILNDDRKLAGKYRKELAEALAPFGSKEMNVELVIKTDYQFAHELYENLGQSSQQMVYELGQDIIWLSKLPPAEFPRESEKLHNKYDAKLAILPRVSEEQIKILDEKFKDPNGNPPLSQEERKVVAAMMLQGMLPVIGIIDTMNVVDANTRMTSIYAQIRAQDVGPKQVADFINSAPPEMQDPFSGHAFRYDAKTNIISSLCKDMYTIVPPACSLSLD